MPRLIRLATAARLAGVTRVALQRKIKEESLPSFEGMVTEEGLLQVYPDIQFDDNTIFEQMTRTKELGLGIRAIERLPNKEVLAARLTALGKELSAARTELARYRSIADGLDERLKAWDDGGEDMQAAAASLRLWMHQELQADAERAGFRNLAIRDIFLRVMAAHVRLQPSGHEFFVEGADTLLEAALRAGLSPTYGCSNGECGQCKARVVSGEVLKVRPHDYALSADEEAAGYALLCSNTAVTDVVIEVGEAQTAADIPFQHVAANVKSIDPLGEDMLLLHLQTPRHDRLRFLAGQNVVLRLGHALAAEFPVAGCPCDDRNLPFHIRKIPGNHFADYVAGKLKVGEAVTLEGPKGDFVLRGASSRPLIFIAFGTGFAPVKSLLEHAMALDAAESMHLYWIVSHEADLYFSNWPRAMAAALDNFRYTPLVVAADMETAAVREASRLDGVLDRIADDYPALSDFDVYAAGPELLIDVARRWLLAHGLPASQLSVGVVR
ncbi:MAG: 2Fe-2S iron-sulfur cluster-binding protein [Rhodocyclaceae bacterium]|nr:2Fe-2S iron-sulfur cluster-binding protein [Rhodocyclaceae bacterium]